MIRPLNYKKSKFNYVIQYDGGHIVFNSASTALIFFDDENFLKYEECKNIDATFANTMYTQGLWVDANEEENFRQEAKREMAILEDKINRHIVIAPTLFCNARCYYCYEQGREFRKMSDSIINDTIEFLVQYAKEGKTLNISWFGGEPLLAVDAIDTIFTSVKKKLPENFGLTSTMTSNGALITDAIIKKMVDQWNLKSIQITLDGMEDYYGKVKNYADGKNYFKKVIDNIEKIAQNNIQVEIRLNISNENIDELNKLIDFLKGKFGQNKKIDIHAMMLIDYCENLDERIVLEEDIYKCAAPIVKKLIDLGFWRGGIESSLRSKNLPCSALKKDFFIIDPDGDLYKCQHHLGDVEHSVGNVKQGVSLNREFCYWCNKNLPDKCDKCVFMPLCQGGCKQANYRCIMTKHIIDILIREWYNQVKKEKANGNLISGK